MFPSCGCDSLCVFPERAVFALYNYARLRTILDRFKEEVAAGAYPALPEVAQLGHEFQRLSSPVRLVTETRTYLLL